MHGKKVLITGANAGIGFETAKALAAQGAQLLFLSRTEANCKKAAREIEAATGCAPIAIYTANLSSQKQIRAAAEKIVAEHAHLDVLINNAGGVFPSFGLSEESIEMTIATNHFAYFLLTHLLLPLLKAAPEARIVNVASDSHYMGKLDFDSFTQQKNYWITGAYAQSKLANVLFTNELAERLRGTNITVNSLHPGLVKTDIGIKHLPFYMAAFWWLHSRVRGISVADGARTSVYLASSPQVKNKTGLYFADCKAKAPSKLVQDKALGKELWQHSEALCPLG